MIVGGGARTPERAVPVMDEEAFVDPQTTGGVFVPARFGYRIATHLVLNLLEPPGLSVPLILAIHGAAGEGKTLQCRLVFEAMGVDAVWPPAEAFESKAAGDAQRALLATYREAGEVNREIDELWRGRSQTSAPCLQIMFINDLDQRIGRKDEAIQQTINTQLVNASLMELADNPRSVSGEPSWRVPVVVTANDLTSIHPPLHRDGRMRRFEWSPTPTERAQTLAAMYPEADLDVDRAMTLMRLAGYSTTEPERAAPEAPSTATLAAIKTMLYEAAAEELIKKHGVAHVLGAVRWGDVDRVDLRPDLSFESLKAALAALRESHHLIDHLATGRSAGRGPIG